MICEFRTTRKPVLALMPPASAALFLNSLNHGCCVHNLLLFVYPLPPVFPAGRLFFRSFVCHPIISWMVCLQTRSMKEAERQTDVHLDELAHPDVRTFGERPNMSM